MIDITTDPDYANIYDDVPVEEEDDEELMEDLRFFMAHVDDMSMDMTLYQKAVYQHKSMFIADPNWAVGLLLL